MNYDRVQLWAPYSMTLQLGHIFSYCLFTAEIRAVMYLEHNNLMYYSFSGPVNLHMFL